MSDPNEIVFEAAAFAARAHRHQMRKDKETPYFSHPVRVCLVVRHVFGFDDPRMLAAALLHDTIEDTTTDCDDIIEQFGPEVAKWVAALSKDSRLPYDEREAAYGKQLAAADWQAKVIKLADQYDNLGDCALSRRARPPQDREEGRGSTSTASATAFRRKDRRRVRLVEERLAKLESSLTA